MLDCFARASLVLQHLYDAKHVWILRWASPSVTFATTLHLYLGAPKPFRPAGKLCRQNPRMVLLRLRSKDVGAVSPASLSWLSDVICMFVSGFRKEDKGNLMIRILRLMKCKWANILAAVFTATCVSCTIVHLPLSLASA
jgi:hypothetical protein